LEEHDVLRVDASLTNHEHALRLTRTSPQAGDIFDRVVRRYDRLRYGAHVISSDEFQQLRSDVERVRMGAA
jgi:hypothetical protein